MFPDPVTGEMKEGIVKVRYSHDAMIDVLIADPSIKQNDLAAMFDRTPPWISRIVNSDAFQARLSERKGELVDPSIVASIQERLRAVADSALRRILDKVEGPIAPSDDFLLQSAKLATAALGYGARVPTSTTNVAVVVQVPAKIASATEWAAAHAPQPVFPG
jgi:hypothetical protein